MLCFAGNSLLCRLALRYSLIDAASFTSIRLISGAVVLTFIGAFRGHRPLQSGSWTSALALFWYAAAFSLAYISLPAGTGALLLFGAVQSTMICWGLRRGEAFGWRQVFGLLLALAGLVALVFPGLTSPPLMGSMLMITAGVAWGVYSLRGKGTADPASATAGNFIRAIPFTIALSVGFLSRAHLDWVGIIYAIVSGAITSGIGYVLWYAVLPNLAATSAGTVQLCVPVLAAIGGIAVLGEQPTLRFVLASVALLTGIAIVIWNRNAAKTRARA